MCNINFQGVLCIGFLKRSRQKKEVSREQAIKDLEVSYLTSEVMSVSESSIGFQFTFQIWMFESEIWLLWPLLYKHLLGWIDDWKNRNWQPTLSKELSVCIVQESLIMMFVGVYNLLCYNHLIWWFKSIFHLEPTWGFLSIIRNTCTTCVLAIPSSL